MSATGYTPISLYYSTTAAAVPVAGNLIAGELALNTLDEKLYFKNSAGTVKLLASNASSSGTVSSVAMTVPSFLSVAGSPITTSGTLAVTLSGTALPVLNGGTGQTSYTDGQLLIGNSTGNTLTKTTLTAGSGVTITNGSGSITINATGTGGTVTSVGQSFTGGLISVSGSPVTTTGTLALTVAGTSGGIPYFSSGTTWASSAVLAANALMVGGGAGAAPATITTGTGVVTALGNSADATSGFATTNGTATLTNKRIDPRVTSATTATSLTPSVASADIYAYTALATDLTINAPTGTPVDGDKLVFRFLDDGTVRLLTWDSTYTPIGVGLPGFTVANKTIYVGCIYNANNTRWDVIASVTQT